MSHFCQQQGRPGSWSQGNGSAVPLTEQEGGRYRDVTRRDADPAETSPPSDGSWSWTRTSGRFVSKNTQKHRKVLWLIRLQLVSPKRDFYKTCVPKTIHKLQIRASWWISTGHHRVSSSDFHVLSEPQGRLIQEKLTSSADGRTDTN